MSKLDFQAAKKRMEAALRAIDSDARSPEELNAIYRERAQILARVESPHEVTAAEAIVIFRLATTRYAIPQHLLSEVIARPRIVPVPDAPSQLAGLIQVRGEIRPVWNLAKLIGANSDLGAPVVLLLRTANRSEQGVLVDEVEDIRNVAEQDRQAAPAESNHAAWMTDDLVVVLQMDEVLSEYSRDKRI